MRYYCWSTRAVTGHYTVRTAWCVMAHLRMCLAQVHKLIFPHKRPIPKTSPASPGTGHLTTIPSAFRSVPKLPFVPAVPVTRAELEVFKSLANYAIPRLLGFDAVFSS